MKISKTELEKRYKDTPTRTLAKELGVSVPTLLVYLRQAGIEIKPVGKPKAIEFK